MCTVLVIVALGLLFLAALTSSLKSAAKGVDGLTGAVRKLDKKFADKMASDKEEVAKRQRMEDLARPQEDNDRII